MGQPKQPSQINSRTEISHLDQGQIAKDVHIPKDNAIRVVKANSLIQNEFSEIKLTYVTSGNGLGEIQTATYYDSGVQQITAITPRAENSGNPEITILDLSLLLAENLSQKYFICQDSVGSVGVFFALDGDLMVPSTGALRDIKVDILSSDSNEVVAYKLANMIQDDSEFYGVNSDSLVIITSAQIGNKTDATDVNTGAIISIKSGTPSNSLNNKYFKVFRPKSILEVSGGFHHVWYNVSASGTDPNPIGTKGGIEVKLDLNDSKTLVKQKTQNAIDSSIYFSSVINDNEDIMVIRCNIPGLVSDTVDVDTQFTHFKTETIGADKKVVRTILLTYNAANEIDEVQSF